MFQALRDRGLLAQHSPGIDTLTGPVRVYAGFDPTAPSLHIGHLSVLAALKVLQQQGAEIILLIGGFTASIGDPTGRSTSRVQQDAATIATNAECIRAQLSRLMPGARIVNNQDWLSQIPFHTFLSHTASRVSVHPLLQRTALERDGLSLMELCYPILQGMDFAHLAAESNVPLVQIGGTDQWGNICSGFDLCRAEDSVFAATVPLLTDKQGRKMGKSIGGAVWLDSERLSPMAFWNVWRDIDDAQVPDIVQRFGISLDDETDINKQKIRIANAMTLWVHGHQAMEQAARAQAAAQAHTITEDTPSHVLNDSNLIDLCVTLKFAPSRKQARTAIESGAIRINGAKTDTIDNVALPFLLSFGKKTHIAIRAG